MKSSLTIPSILRGSLIQLRRKCGKPNCRCAQGKLHSSPALSYSQRGRTSILTLPEGQVPKVRAALQRYRGGQQSWQRQADAGLRQLARQLRRSRRTGH